MNLEARQTNIEYHPHFGNLSELIKDHEKLTPEEEVLEMTHLRFDLEIPTAKLFSQLTTQLKEMNLDGKNSQELIGELSLACLANDEDILQRSTLNEIPFDEKTTSKLFKIAVNYYKTHAKGQN